MAHPFPIVNAFFHIKCTFLVSACFAYSFSSTFFALVAVRGGFFGGVFGGFFATSGAGFFHLSTLFGTVLAKAKPMPFWVHTKYVPSLTILFGTLLACLARHVPTMP